jgi:hypothetical protein
MERLFQNKTDPSEVGKIVLCQIVIFSSITQYKRIKDKLHQL